MTEMGEKFDKRLTVDVVIPTYKPDRRFARLIRRLGQQTYPINKIIVVNTEKQDWKPEYCKKVKNLEVHHVSRQEFDHGRTRNFGASLSQGDIISHVPFIYFDDDGAQKIFSADAFVLSTSCHIDQKERIILVPIFPLEGFDGNLVDLKRNTIFDYMYIPDECMSDKFIDFEYMNTYSKNLIIKGIAEGKIRRLGSLNQLGYYFFVVK